MNTNTVNVTIESADKEESIYVIVDAPTMTAAINLVAGRCYNGEFGKGWVVDVLTTIDENPGVPFGAWDVI